MEPVHEDDPTIGRLVAQASSDLSLLVSKEIQLLKSELKVSARFSGLAAGMFAGAAFLLVLAIIMLSVSIAYFFHWLGLGLAVSFLLVFVLYLLIAGGLVFVGIRAIKRVKGPERAVAQGQGIARAVRGQA